MQSQQPITFILFGATGDLAQKKILPALLNLFISQKLPLHSKIVVFSRRPWKDSDYHTFITPSLEKLTDQATLQGFFRNIRYVEGVFDTQESYIRLKKNLENIDSELQTETEKIFHLAIQPEFYEKVIFGLAEQKLLNKPHKILIEKPFGHDVASAQALEKKLEDVISENRIYRIDHYLGKAGLWNSLNAPISWNTIQKIQVTFFEKIGIEGRGDFYESVGVIKDVVQNHVLEMFAFAVVNHPPTQELPLARADVIKKLQPITTLERGQYEGYLREADVKPDSQTETYVKYSTTFESIPVIFEAGKMMGEKRSEVVFTLKDGSTIAFNSDDKKLKNGEAWPDAYEVVIDAALRSDKKFFVSIDEVVASWKFVDPIIKKLPMVELKTY